MADNGRWFKLWTSAPDDPDLDNLDIADFGRWAKLGAIVKEHGERGVLTISAPARGLCAQMQVSTFDELLFCLKKLPNIDVDEKQKYDNGKVIVTFRHWYKYQEDSTVYERVKKWREGQFVTGQEEKRREEKRRDKEEKKKEYSPDAIRLSGLLFTKIIENNPENRMAALSETEKGVVITRWAKDVQLLLSKDQQEPSIVEEIIRWCQQDDFWRGNILSGHTLRAKWDTLTAGEGIKALLEQLQEQASTRESERLPSQKAEKRALASEEVRVILEAIGIPVRYRCAKKGDIHAGVWDMTEGYRRGIKDGLFLYGEPGRGKSYLAAALIRARVESLKVSATIPDGAYVETGMRWISVTDMLLEIKACFREGAAVDSEDRIISKYTEIPYLTLDDIGPEKTARAASTERRPCALCRH